jgi:hypothetical protein
MIYIIILLLVIVALLGYLVYINYRRAERVTEYCEVYIRFVSTLYFKFTETRDRMKEIDRIGAFQADDEVGTTFKDLEEQINSLYAFITKYVNREQTEENEKTKN